MEWSNAFNVVNGQAKGLTYYDNFKKILGWMEGGNPLPPPVEASLDPNPFCQQNCYYCSSNRYRQVKQGDGVRRWGLDYMEDLLCELFQMGVKGFCWGGREASLNIRLADATRMGVALGMEAAIVTNGIIMPDKLIDAYLLCSWVGISVDTTKPEIYLRVRGTDNCDQVWGHIAQLAARKTKTLVSARALVLPETIDTLYDVCYRAREVGCNFALIRPADLERKDLSIANRVNLDVPRILEIIERCHELETKDFKVFTVVHKYGPDLKVQHHFKRCLASPLVIQICADKRKYICVDHRMDSRFEVKEWGSDQHRELIKNIKPDKDCSRCTWDAYNRIIEEVVIGDALGRNFP